MPHLDMRIRFINDKIEVKKKEIKEEEQNTCNWMSRVSPGLMIATPKFLELPRAGVM